MKYEFDVSQSEGNVLATLTGDLTIKNASAIAGDLSSIVGLNVTIELRNPTEIDLSFIQLLVSTVYHLSQQGARTGIKLSVKEADLELLTNTGFTRLLQPATP